ncbi:competence/damage-inducible protein A [soil metagenome]
MRAIVINTGTELLLGSTLNTHLTFLARELFPLGLRIDQQLTVPDGAAIRDALVRAMAEAELVFVTGGLGPTTDDLTREISAELLGLPLREDATVLAAITARLVLRGFPMTGRILRQAQVPAGAVVLPNANGTAPGLYIAATGDHPHLFLLPGPPRELHPMVRESVLPILQPLTTARAAVSHRTLSLACVGESMVEAAVGPKLLALPEVELGYCAHAGAVDVRVLGPEAAVVEAERIICAEFPEAVFTDSGESLEGVVVRLLTARRETVAAAESCTGGYLAHRITNVPGASAVFLAGFVTYANEAKASALGVEAELIQLHGAVSEAVVRQMAEGARREANATYALATTGIAGPGGGSPEKPVGTVFIALASAHAETEVLQRLFPADRETFKQLASQHALDLLRRRLSAQGIGALN